MAGISPIRRGGIRSALLIELIGVILSVGVILATSVIHPFHGHLVLIYGLVAGYCLYKIIQHCSRPRPVTKWYHLSYWYPSNWYSPSSYSRTYHSHHYHHEPYWAPSPSYSFRHQPSSQPTVGTQSGRGGVNDQL